MKLLLGRKQTYSAAFSLVPLRIGSGTIFNLWASLELDEEEKSLLNKYNLTKAHLVISDPIEDIKNSLKPALFLGIVALIVLAFFLRPMAAFIGALGVTVVMTVIYFKTLREQILVSDLMHGGRKFPCESIVALIQKEAYLEFICEFLRQVLESAKTWDDREAITIKPLEKKAAKQAVLEMLGKL